MNRINPDIATPMYMQLKNILTKQINDEFYHDGQKLPSERELCDMFKVSRMTVRQALAELENTGLIKKYQGKGTYVSKPKVEQELLKITPFRETLLAKGIMPATKFISYQEVQNSYKLSTALKAPMDEKVAKIEILGLGDDVPISYYTSHFAIKTGLKMDHLIHELIKKDQPCTTLDVYREFNDIEIGFIYQTFEASLSDKISAKLLDIKIKSPILKVKSTICSKDDTPIECRSAIYRGDMYKFSTIRNYK